MPRSTWAPGRCCGRYSPNASCGSRHTTWWSTASPGGSCWKTWTPPTTKPCAASRSGCRRRPPASSSGPTGWTGRDRVLIDLEGHGREDLFDRVDLSRTVGWFTTLFPVALDIPGLDWGRTLKSVKEQLRAIPGKGIGYGALRYLRQAVEPVE